jgi:hypothetical protein
MSGSRSGISLALCARCSNITIGLLRHCPQKYIAYLPANSFKFTPQEHLNRLLISSYKPKLLNPYFEKLIDFNSLNEMFTHLGRADRELIAEHIGRSDTCTGRGRLLLNPYKEAFTKTIPNAC